MALSASVRECNLEVDSRGVPALWCLARVTGDGLYVVVGKQRSHQQEVRRLIVRAVIELLPSVAAPLVAAAGMRCRVNPDGETRALVLEKDGWHWESTTEAPAPIVFGVSAA